MKGPEHVYPAVLLLRTVPSDISGVMITQDVDNGDPGVLSVAVNEGVGGAVDGQAAESVRIDRARRQRAPHGGGDRAAAAGAAAHRRHRQAPDLGRRHAAAGRTRSQQLIAFADEIPQQFPQLGEDGKPVAADVEFAFVDGKLWLLQIRPFNESRQARARSHLSEMDKALAGQSRHDA